MWKCDSMLERGFGARTEPVLYFGPGLLYFGPGLLPLFSTRPAAV